MARSDISLEKLTAEVRDIYWADEANSVANVERYLEETLTDCSPAERSEVLRELITAFSHCSSGSAVNSGVALEDFNTLLTTLLGKEVLEKKLPPAEMIEQLAVAVNTVFDSVNDLVSGMNASLMGDAESEETIRVVIRASLDADEGLVALRKFLDQTGEFFAIALKAYKEAARVKISEILDELDPEHLEKEVEDKVKIGPLYKAHLYDCYQEKYSTLRNWQRSGLLLEAFLKEFEKNCQNFYSGIDLK